MLLGMMRFSSWMLTTYDQCPRKLAATLTFQQVGLATK
jgi:hypothetical protein